MRDADENIKKITGPPENNPFSVPEGYFEGFAERLQNRIETSSTEKQPVKILKVARPLLSLAAAVSLFALMTYAVIHFVLPGHNALNYEQSIAMYLDNQIYQIDESMIVDGYEEESANISNEEMEQAILEYLDNTPDDYSIITNEF